jgi:sugar lactone lactonase YvrE
MRLQFFILLSTLSVAVAGCGSAGTPGISGPVSETEGAPIAGKVHGGQQPVSGAKVYLFAAGTGGYASAPTSLLKSPGYVTTATDGSGSFNITGDWTCPSAPGDQVYLLAVGGNPGNSGGQSNPNLVLMAALGSCGSLSGSTFIVINEVTTAASAYSLAPFMGYGESNPAAGTAVNVGAPAGGSSCNSAGNWLSTGANTCDYIGLKNAFGTTSVLASLSTGQAQTGAANDVLPQSQLDTLADILAACVNSTGGSAGDGAGGAGVDSLCGQLFDNTTPGSTGVAPTDTLQAILNLARNQGPSATIGANLLSLSSSMAPFQPSLTNVPHDWTLPITLSGGGVDGPTMLGADSAGNIWAVSYYGFLSEFSPAGVPVFASGITGYGLHESWAMTIDSSGDVWAANDETQGINNNLGSVSEFTNSGAPLSGSLGFDAGGIYYPEALAADTDGSVWVADYGDSSVTHLTSSGTDAAGPLTSGSIEFPDAIAVDANHNAWVASETTSTITKISADGTQFTPVNCCDEAAGLAIDASGNIWSANYRGNSVSLVSSAGTVISSGYTGEGLNHPNGIAVDGSGTVWVTNYRGASFTELSGAASTTPGSILSPSTGFGTDAGLLEPYGIAIDASGNVWISSFATVPSAGQQGTITEFVGLATPVKTPLVGPVQIP